MQTKTESLAEEEQETGALSGAGADIVDEEEAAREETLQWLMQLNRDEPEEKVFIVNATTADFSLSAQEAAVAARPMIRGRADADDLSSYVDEEIVMGEEGGSSSGQAADSEGGGGFGDIDALMAVDFSRDVSSEEAGLLDVEEGSDILGLEDEDDIGEQYLVVKRVKRQPGLVEGDGEAEAEAAEAPIVLTPVEVESEVELEVAAEVEPLVALEAGPVAELEAELEVEPLAAAAPFAVEVPLDMAGQVDVAAGLSVPETRDVEFEVDLDLGVDLELDTTAEDTAVFAELPVGIASVDDFETLAEADLAAFDSAGEAAGLVEYHEDFQELAPQESAHSIVMPRIAALMSELEIALAARLGALSRSLDSVLSEVSISDNAGEWDELRSEGFAPLAEVCSVIPEAVADLDASILAAVFLRLQDTVSGKLCNRIFHEEPLAGRSQADAAAELLLAGEPEVLAETVEAKTGSELKAGLRLVESRIFDEDLLDDNELDLESAELSVPDEVDGWLPDGEEIEAIFDGLDGGDPFDSGLEVPPAMSELEEPLEAAEAAPETSVAAAEDEDWAWCIPADIRFSSCSPGSGEIFADFLDAFIEEGSTELEKLEAAISGWEADVESTERPLEVGRVLHTIKGIAKGVGLHYYGTLIHNFETLLEELPRPVTGQAGDFFRILNAWLDAALSGLDVVQERRRDIDYELPGARKALAETSADLAREMTAEAPLQEEVAAAAVEPVVLPELSVEDVRRKEADKKLADEGARVLAAQQSVRITSEKLDLLLNLTNQAQQLGVRTVQSASRTKRSTAELQGRLTSVRAHIADIASGGLFNVTASGGQSGENLDALEMDRYSELQEAANILREGVEDLADLIELVSKHNSQSEALLKQQATVISSIGSSIRAARVVPVSRLTPGLRRLVRTVSADLGKEVAFRVVNEVGTLDRDDYARCQTILEHMVRNALDHGIEGSAERQAAGKPSVGQISLDLRKSGADTVIVLSDDGRGMDPARIRASAKSKGIGGDVDALCDEEALNLIFSKGFSTASEVSQISGRGVGMDIVASELQKMGGEIRITSEPGRGTSFHLRIPTNVAVNGALLVSAGDNSYAVPLGGLIAVDELPVDRFFDAVEQGETLTLSSMVCEPAYLGTLCNSCNLPERSAWRSTIPVLIAGNDTRRMAIAVDDVEEALELVIRTLGVQFAAVPGVAGAATTADGEAVVALDLNVLVSCFEEGQSTAVAMDRPQEDKLLVLVVDDSRTQRMVATSQLESVGLETATAENGAVAIDWLNTTDRLPDIVLMDVEMPVKDGIQALRDIRKSSRFADLPVIMITSRTGVKHRTLAEEAGCNGYMGKPFNFRMLIGQINDLTGHRLELDQQE